MSRIDIKDYLVKQVKFSLGNLLSVPVGLFLLWFFTSELGVYYLLSSILSMAVTTTMNFWVGVFLKVIRLSDKS